jgi:excisionase family DNA binding protein
MRLPVPALPALGPSSTELLPRLLDVAGAAVYLSVAPGTVRQLVHDGILRRVRIPLPDQGELRRLLLDRLDLDQLVERSKA